MLPNYPISQRPQNVIQVVYMTEITTVGHWPEMYCDKTNKYGMCIQHRLITAPSAVQSDPSHCHKPCLQQRILAFQTKCTYSYQIGFIGGCHGLRMHRLIETSRSTYEPRHEKFCLRNNRAIQPQKIAIGFQFRILEVVDLFYLCSENKGADQLCGNHTAFLRLCF